MVQSTSVSNRSRVGKAKGSSRKKMAKRIEMNEEEKENISDDSAGQDYDDEDKKPSKAKSKDVKKAKKDDDEEKMEEQEEKKSDKKKKVSGSNKKAKSNRNNTSITGFQDIIKLQKVNGSWLWDEICDLIGLTDEVKEHHPEDDATFWVTLIVIQYLEKNFSDSKNLWQLSAKKAISFVKKYCKSNGVDYDELLEEASNTI